MMCKVAVKNRNQRRYEMKEAIKLVENALEILKSEEKNEKVV